MRFTRLELDDFMSYDEQSLDLDGLDYVAIAGRNGSGKSSLALAIAWALFGTIRVKGDSDSVVRDGATKCAVVLEFVSGGTNWRIERSKSRGKSAKVRLMSGDGEGNWVPYGDHLNATAQSRIEELAGMSEDAFYSLTIIDGQSGARFVKADSSMRREILLNLLPEMSMWGQLEEASRKELASATSSVSADQARLESDDERITETKARVAEEQRILDELEPDSIEESLTTVERDIAKLDKKISAKVSAEQDALEKAEREFNARKRELRADLNDAKGKADAAAAAVRQWKTAKSDHEEAAERIKVEQDALDAAKATLEEAIAADEKSAKRQSELRELSAAVRGHEERVAVLRAQISADKESLNNLAQLHVGESHEIDCPTCQTTLSADKIESLVASIERGVADAQSELERESEDLKDARRQADELAESIDAAAEAIERAESQVDRAEQSLERAQEDAERYKKRLAGTAEETGYNSLEDAQEAADKAQEAVDKADDELDTFISEGERNLDALEEAADAAKNDAAESKDGKMLADLRAQRRELVEQSKDVERRRGQIKAMQDSIRETTNAMRERRDSIKDTLARIEHLEFLVSACRPQGIPSMLLDGVLAPIETEATRILSAVPGGEGMMLRFEQARQLKSRAGSKEVLDIIVTLPTGVERPIESLSAGETVRVSLALVFAMISVLGSRHGGDALDTVFLDEPLGPLDQEAVPAFVEVLRSAVSAGSLSSVMVVTHDQRVIEALPQRIEVEREHGVSHAVLVS